MMTALMIEEDKRKELMGDTIRNQKVVIEADSDKLITELAGRKITPGKTHCQYVPVSFFFYGIELEMRANQNADKAIVMVYRQFVPDKLIKGFLAEGHPERLYKNIYMMMDTPEMICFRKRAEIIIGMAFSAVIPTSRVSCYRKRQKAQDRYFRMHHKQLNAFVKQHAELSGIFVDDFEKALMALWFHYPQNLTGYDEIIKQDSLRLYHPIKKALEK